MIYDGDCPFCARYSKFVQLKKKVQIELIDARQAQETILTLKKQGFDINHGMILIQNREKVFHGKFAALKVNELLGDLTFIQSLVLKITSFPALMNIIYPILNALRKSLLTLMGKNKRL